jgi:hypothetical protein
MNEPEQIQHLLTNTTIWAVVGLGTNPDRPAFGVSQLLQTKGKRIVPVHPVATEVHGEPAFTSLKAAAAAVGHIEVVDCFVNSDRVGEVVSDAIEIGADAVWLQLGVIDNEAAERAAQAGLVVVMDRCPAIEWSGPASN